MDFYVLQENTENKLYALSKGRDKKNGKIQDLVLSRRPPPPFPIGIFRTFLVTFGQRSRVFKAKTHTILEV